jgi:integrase
MNMLKSYGRGRPQSKKKKAATTRRAPPPTKALSWQTKAHALNLLRQAFVIAIEDEIVGEGFDNPCIGVKFKRPPTTEVATNFFTRSEIERVQARAREIDRPLIEFAIASGLRQGEMRALRDEDVHADATPPYVTIRYGRPPKKPTKSGQPRDVPLLPMALRALGEWRALRATWCKNNYKGLAFPAQYGGYRSEGKMLGRRTQEIWTTLLADVGVHRHVVWHDLRHTCATALLGGYFGRKWRLEEIQQLLGHAEIETTQRYAHALQQTLNEAASETFGDIKPTRAA